MATMFTVDPARIREQHGIHKKIPQNRLLSLSSIKLFAPIDNTGCFRYTMKLNLLFVILALCSSSVSILAAPLPQPGVGGALKKAFSSVFESSASKEIKNAPYYSEEYVAQPGFEQYGNHAQKPGGLDSKKSKKGRKKDWASEPSSSSTPPPSFSGEGHAAESPRRSDVSRESSSQSMSPLQAQLPYHPPRPAAFGQPYVGMQHSVPPPTYHYANEAHHQPYHYPQAPQGGYAMHQQLDWTGGYHPQPAYAHPSQSYGEHGGSYHYYHGMPGQQVFGGHPHQVQEHPAQERIGWFWK